MFVLLRHEDEDISDIAVYGVQDWQHNEESTTVWFPASANKDEAETYSGYMPVASECGNSLYTNEAYLEEHIEEMEAREDITVLVFPSVENSMLYEFVDAGSDDKWATL